MPQMSFNTHLDKPLHVSLSRALSPLDNPDLLLVPAYLEFSMCFDLKQRMCLFHNWWSICHFLIIFDIIYFGLLSGLCCFLISSSFFPNSLWFNHTVKQQLPRNRRGMHKPVKLSWYFPLFTVFMHFFMQTLVIYDHHKWMGKKLGSCKALYVTNKKIYKFVAAFHMTLCKSY